MSKKTFKENPACQFLSGTQTPEPVPAPGPEQSPPERRRGEEVRNRRLQLLMQPSLYQRVKRRAEAQGVSVNEYVHRVLDEVTKEG